MGPTLAATTEVLAFRGMKPFQFVDSSVELGSGGLADSFRDEESDGQRKSTSHSPPQNTSPFADGVLFTKIVFVLTGVAQTLLAQVAFYAGGAAPSSLLPVAANYFGCFLSLLIPQHEVAKEKESIETDVFSRSRCGTMVPAVTPLAGRFIAGLAVLDFVGHTLSILGLMSAGSGTYQVIYSTVVVFAAVWSQLILKRVLSSQHWLAVVLAAFGLSLSVLGHGSPHEVAEDHSVEVEKEHRYVFGVALTLLGTLVFSFHYTVADYLAALPNAPTGHAIRTRLGFYLAAMACAYEVFVTLPNFQELVLDQIHPGKGLTVFLTYLSLIVASCLHLISFFQLMGKIGAVSIGILQTARSVFVFVLSHVLFCSSHEEQCFTMWKGVSTVVVTSAIFFFTQLPPPLKRQSQKNLVTSI